jgi:hypothetical protein
VSGRSARVAPSGSFSQLVRLSSDPLDGNYGHDALTDWNMEVRGSVLIVKGSVRRAIHPADNLLPVSVSDLPAVYSYITTFARTLGLSFSMDTLSPCRVDMAADIRLPNCPSLIDNLSHVSRFNKMHLAFVALDPKKHEASIRWQSGVKGKLKKRPGSQRQLAVYDKTKELRDKGHPAPAGRHILRIEYRLLHRQACRHAGITTMADMFQPDKQRALLAGILQSLLRAAHRQGVRGAAWQLLNLWANSIEAAG